jgi:hypothetical protein
MHPPISFGDARSVLASDLDGTLVPPERSDERLREVARFSGAVTTGGMGLAYVTGRHLRSAVACIEELGLPWPSALVCDVGTSVYTRSDERYRIDTAYRALMQEAMGDVRAAMLHEALATLEGLRLQPEDSQAEFKVSYFVAAERYAHVLEAVSDALAPVASVTLVASRDPETGHGALDLLPATVSKAYAVDYLARNAGVDDERLIYAGDSGNDLHALLSGRPAIVVGNAHPDLKVQLRDEAASRGIADSVYFADARYVAGVLEGLEHFGVL